MRNVTVRQLQMFVEAADQRSFAKAADKLNVSPAAVSFQIRQIEDMSGFALFERIGRQVSLTDAGEALLGYARIVLRALHDADQSLMALRGVVSGRATLGSVSTGKYIVPHVMARFQTLYPGVAINLRFGNKKQITDALERGEIELAIMGAPPEGADLVARAFAPHPSVLIAPPNHRLAGAARVSVASLGNESVIVREEGSGTRLMLERVWAAAGVTPRIGMTTDSNETVKQAVMAGMGVALISRHTIGLELALGLLRVLPVEGFPLMREWFVTHRRAMPLMPAHVKLSGFILAHGREVIDGLEVAYRTSG